MSGWMLRRCLNSNHPRRRTPRVIAQLVVAYQGLPMQPCAQSRALASHWTKVQKHGHKTSHSAPSVPFTFLTWGVGNKAGQANKRLTGTIAWQIGANSSMGWFQKKKKKNPANSLGCIFDVELATRCDGTQGARREKNTAVCPRRCSSTSCLASEVSVSGCNYLNKKAFSKEA